MKNKALIAVIASLIIICTGCGASVVEEAPQQSKTSMFVEVEDSVTFSVVYHKETKVMYTISKGSHNYGSFTLLVNADGSPMTYKRE